MGVRIFSLLLFILGVVVILHRERSNRTIQIHYPAPVYKLTKLGSAIIKRYKRATILHHWEVQRSTATDDRTI